MWMKTVKRKYKVEVNDDHKFSFPTDPGAMGVRKNNGTEEESPDNEDGVEMLGRSCWTLYTRWSVHMWQSKHKLVANLTSTKTKAFSVSYGQGSSQDKHNKKGKCFICGWFLCRFGVHQAHLDKEGLENFIPVVRYVQTLGGVKHRIAGLGTSRGKLRNRAGKKSVDVVLENSMVCPDATKNLASVDKFMDDTGGVLFQRGIIVPYRDSIPRSEVIRVNGKVNADLLEKHCDLAHLNFGKIKDMIKAGKVTGITNLGRQVGWCEHCQLGKAHKKKFGIRKSASRLLELIHSNVCGPMHTVGLKGERIEERIDPEEACQKDNTEVPVREYQAGQATVREEQVKDGSGKDQDKLDRANQVEGKDPADPKGRGARENIGHKGEPDDENIVMEEAEEGQQQVEDLGNPVEDLANKFYHGPATGGAISTSNSITDPNDSYPYRSP
ncbi:hypothetical protein TRICI_001203 [Trichomonascus ciferrii]|uniref:GAG-pre-integrase domain-containing protein n=1 Tax=Trichomonascus ciferrii TaxID=44093 RepID=A0A642VAF4_9ASCO|nr:hypothetical protein TRICI_001203 [Trichomonascus ciferrii]